MAWDWADDRRKDEAASLVRALHAEGFDAYVDVERLEITRLSCLGCGALLAQRELHAEACEPLRRIQQGARPLRPASQVDAAIGDVQQIMARRAEPVTLAELADEVTSVQIPESAVYLAVHALERRGTIRRTRDFQFVLRPSQPSPRRH